MKQIIKRLVAALLTAITLVFVPVNGYQNAITCHAAAESAMFYALRALIEAMALSMGYSYQTQADLDTSTRGLENLIESYKDCDDLSDAVHLTTLFNMLAGKHIGDTIKTVYEKTSVNMPIIRAIQYVRDYVAGQIKRSGGSYDSSKDFGRDRSELVLQDITESTFKHCLYDISTDCVPEKHMLDGGFMACTVPRTDLSQYYQYWYVYCADFGVDFLAPDCPYILTCEFDDDGVRHLYCRTKASGALQSKFRIYSYAQETPNSKVTKQSYGSTTSVINFDGSYAVDTIYTAQRIYDSYADYLIYADIVMKYPIENTMLGDTSISTSIPDSVTITQTPTKTKEVEATVTKEKEENPAITRDDLDKAVAKIISSTTATDKPSDSSTTDSAALSDIIFSLSFIRELLQQFQKDWTDGSSALQREVEDVRDNFTVIEGGGDSGSNPEDEDPKIWVPPLFFASRLLKPVMEYFGNPLSEITKFLNRILNSISNLPLLFDKEGELYIGHIFSDMSSIVSYVGSIAQTVKNLPKDIADLIEIPVLNPQEIVEALNEGLVFPNLPVELPEINIPEIKVPDVNVEFPAIPNYMSVLNNILLAVQNIFVIDTAAVDVSAKKLVGIWDKHLPFIPKVQKLISSVSFSDAYEYPVIKIGTPKNIRPYYDSDYIVLLDFGNSDVRQYFVWARTIIKAGLWIAFLYSLLRHFKVRFHVG